MEEKQILGLMRETPQILITIYGDLAQPSVKKVGIALETVFEFSTSFLLPLKLLNEKFKLNFKKRLNEYRKKLENIPDEELCEVHPQIGIPIIEKLSYTTNDEISELFVELLTKASIINTRNMAHPSFIQLIERLSVDEARIIKYLKEKDIVLCISFRAHLKEKEGFHTILTNGTLIQFEIELFFPQNIKIYLDNLTSIGILDVSHGLHRIDEEQYSLLYEKYDYENINEKYINEYNYKNVSKEKSYYGITDFGKEFIVACTS